MEKFIKYSLLFIAISASLILGNSLINIITENIILNPLIKIIYIYLVVALVVGPQKFLEQTHQIGIKCKNFMINLKKKVK